MADGDYAMRVVCAVQDSATQTYLALRGMKTPEAAFQEKQAAVNASIDQALQGHHSAQSGAEADQFREDILKHSAELHQLRQDHQSTLDAKTKDFEHQRRLVIENLCRLLVHAVGRDLFQSALPDLTNDPSHAVSSTSAPADQPIPPATEAESEVVSPAEHSVRPPPASPERPPKRKTNAEPQSNKRRKRTVPTNKRISSIWFDEVYQNGQAETKHIIVEHPKGAGKWYIIRCQDCPRDFQERPLVTAGSHLGSNAHGYQSRYSEAVVEKFGIDVLDCNEVLAEKNNAVARKAFRKQGKGPRPPDDTAKKSSKQGRRGAAFIVSPTPGQIYLSYCSKAKKSWPVLLLPTANLEDVGVPDTLEDLGLLDKLPPCYRYDTTTKTLEWVEGFEDGGEKVAQRRFPVMFFDDGLKFPSESEVSWLPARKLEVLDIESGVASEVPHIRSVRAYLSARAGTPSRQDESSEMDLRDDAMGLEDETHQTPEADRRNSPEPIMSKPWGTGVEAGLMPAVNDHGTSIGDHGNSDHNLRKKSFDIISISSTPASESRETNPDEAAVPSHSELNRTISAPNADVKTTASANMSANDSDQTIQVNTVVEATARAPHLIHQPSAEPAQASEIRADYLATIAQNGLGQNLGLSDSVMPGTARRVTSRQDNTHKIVATYSDFSRMCSLGRPANHTTTTSPRAENFRNPFTNQNLPHEYHRPNTPQVGNRDNNSAIPPGQSQPQPQINNRFAPIQPNLQSKVVQEQSIVKEPDPRHTDQHGSWSRHGDPGAALHTNKGVSDHNRTGIVGNDPSRSVTPYQGFSALHPAWRSINGLR